jgi:hypothetical protein
MIMANHAHLRRPMLLAGFLASSIVFSPALAAATQEPGAPPRADQAVTSPVDSSTPASAPLGSISRTVNSTRAAMMYHRLWGIDNITLKATASGSVIRFSYLVVDANKAKVLNDKKEEPYLLVQKNGARLEVPATEKVGKLRQTATPENGRDYWMVFQNASHMVQPGDRMNIVIGTFHADGLVVEPSMSTLEDKKPLKE